MGWRQLNVHFHTIVAVRRAPTADSAHVVHDRRQPRRKARRAWAWADLMRRVFAINVLTCAACDGRLRLLATIEDPPIPSKILTSDCPGEAPVVTPARPPPEPDCFNFAPPKHAAAAAPRAPKDARAALRPDNAARVSNPTSSAARTPRTSRLVSRVANGSSGAPPIRGDSSNSGKNTAKDDYQRLGEDLRGEAQRDAADGYSSNQRARARS